MSTVKPSVNNPIVDDQGHRYKSLRELSKKIKVARSCITKALKEKGYFNFDDRKYTLVYDPATETPETEITPEMTSEFKEYLKEREVKQLPFETYNFKADTKEKGYRYAVALFSDLHVEETVEPESVNFLNEYNVDIATKRVETYFKNLAECLDRDDVDELIFACLGDLISGYIHDELSQENGLTPLEATFKAQSLVYSGLHYLCCIKKPSKLKKIRFIGIVGNHSRTTKKIQHANGYKMSYEWLMYQNIKKQCELTNLPIEFHIPESELAVVKTCDNKTFIFLHGFQVRSSGSGTICGIYPALNRLSLKYTKVFKQDKIFLGHFHSTVNTPNAVVNGSIISYNSFAMTNGFDYERPQQQYLCYDTGIGGELLTRQIYCD